MKVCNECKQPLDYQHDDRCAERHPSADYDLTQPLTPPNVGKLGQPAEQFEKERIARTDFGLNEGESWDHPEETRSTIASMAASRAPAMVRAAQAGRAVMVNGDPTRVAMPPQQQLQARVPDVPAEVGLMVHAAVRELSRELRGTMEELIHDVNANTRLLGVINAPMEAITGAHERASKSFETLRRDILGGGMDKLEQVLDVSGLSEQASKTEQRLEALVTRLEAKVDQALTQNAKAMVDVLNLLNRLHSRELHRANRQKLKRAKKVPA
jgi:hypothetical protein